MRDKLYDPLTHRVEATPERTALVDAETGETTDYATLDKRVDGFAASLRRLGVDKGDHLGVLMETRTEFFVLVHASTRLNTPLVPINVRLTPSEVEERLDAADVSAVVCEAETEEKVRGAVKTEPGGLTRVTVDEAESDGVESLDTDPSTASDAFVTRLPRSPLDTACIPFTSGTEGDSKPVRLSYANFVSSATASALRLGHLPDDRRLVCLPMYHMGGLSHVFRSTLHGTTAVVQEGGGFDAKETVDNIVEYGVTQVSMVPTMLRRILDTGRASELDSLRYVLLGGAPATEELLRDAAEEGITVSPTYGMTETASQIATVTPGTLFDEAGPESVGHPLVTTRVRIVDEGEVVGAEETGEVVVSGPTVTDGYYGEPEATRDAFCEHGLKTGDIGYKDVSGHLYVVGRKDDTIITGGEKVSPDEVASVILEHPRVKEAAVLGVEDLDWGEKVCALVVARDGDKKVSIKEHCADRLAGHKRPRTYVFVDEIPRTASGTVDREAARDLIE